MLFWTLACTAGFCVGLAKGGAPGFGVLAVPLMSLVISPVVAAGVLLPVFVFSDIFAIAAYRKFVNWAVLRIAVVGIVLGTGLGWATAHLVSENLVRLLIGVIGLVFSINFLIRSGQNDVGKPATRLLGTFWTTVAGFTSFVSHAGAPPWQAWILPQRLPKQVLAGTSAIGFAVMNSLKIIPYYALGQLDAENLKVTLILFIPALCAVFVAFQALRVIPERIFYAAVTWMLLAVSLKLIWDGAGL